LLKIAIIGAGVVGTAIGYLLKQSGYPVVAIASRTLKSARRAKAFIGGGVASTDLAKTARKADIIFITTSDSAIKETCDKIALENGFRLGSVVFHTCGALPSGILKSARKKGAQVASIHPLQSLANVQEAVKNIRGSFFCIEGDEAALEVARNIVRALGGKEISLNVDKKPLYHAGASVASNFLVATVGFGLELFEAAGINKYDSLKALMPLIKGTVNNIERLGIPSALTGPVSRGDSGIIEDHLRSIAKERPGILNLYTELGRYTVKIALEKKTITQNVAQRIMSLFNKYEERVRNYA
jgi:predicted short-subunit dehydrogenase-like oxidoreductase (DUF2520 family)